MDMRFIIKIAVMEELLVMLYEEKFTSRPDPPAAAREYAEYVQTKIESMELPEGMTENMGMEMEAAYARFFERVARRLRKPGQDPSQQPNS